MPRTLVYARVSTKGQVTDGDSICGQAHDALEHCKRLESEESLIYVDPGLSAGELEPWDRHGGELPEGVRERLDRICSDYPCEQRSGGAAALLKECRPGDILVMTEMDRLWREPADCLWTIKKELRPKKTRISAANFLGGRILDYSQGSLDLAYLTFAQVFSEQERTTTSRRNRDRFARDIREHRPVCDQCPAGMYNTGRKDAHKKWILAPCTKSREYMGRIAYMIDTLGCRWNQVAMEMYHREALKRPRLNDGYGLEVWGKPLAPMYWDKVKHRWNMRHYESLMRYYRDEKIFQQQEAKDLSAARSP